ncbi:radical SAM family heme chaperone HemW [Aquiflexum sp. TKW24L]|uniref:radical SAM family heme chaperone HemW n=1 Tax=Aquiflexum sp. TKW24L TaxID=2942212 RepID=UPI0020C01FBB|nr:radical SAM family heme chaperone HemW [Aquiflexum sp. TKW24L]MCL6259187.1 radical SAM family heme chaperone HemW [Aquiflexum sp. TKW24L]
MSGIYIHIPFCKQACHYCDFHFSTNKDLMEDMVDSICLELEQRKDFFQKGDAVKTVYFGGGTPSLLSKHHLERILEKITTRYSLDLEEVTLEANPDDLSTSNLQNWKALGIDRLSIGIQTFNPEILKFYNRAHTAEESLKAIESAKSTGFEKLSVDLIYGFPSTNHDLWKRDLEIALSQNPRHISSYCLTVEPKTALGNWHKKGKYKAASEDFAAEQFEILMQSMEDAGYVQYEISNFGKSDQFAIHNTNYWLGVPYLGIGPSAHSFDGKNRGSNIANNAQYIKKLKTGESIYAKEILSKEDAANDYLLTSLRTIWGTDLTYLKDYSGYDLADLKKDTFKMLRQEKLILEDTNKIILTKKGRLLADSIAESLFLP